MLICDLKRQHQNINLPNLTYSFSFNSLSRWIKPTQGLRRHPHQTFLYHRPFPHNNHLLPPSAFVPNPWYLHPPTTTSLHPALTYPHHLPHPTFKIITSVFWSTVHNHIYFVICSCWWWWYLICNVLYAKGYTLMLCCII